MKERFKRLNEKIDDLEKAESLEEIIIASWKIFRANLKNTERQALLISIIDNKKADFYRKELLTRKDEVYMELITNFINNRDDDIISKTCKKTNLAWWEIKEILLTVKNPSKIDMALAKYVMTKCPKEYTKEKELSHRIREAFIKVMLVENSGVSTFLEFEKKYKASRIEIAQAYDTIKYYKNDVYKSLRFPLKFNEYKSKMVTSAFTEYINREKTVAKEEIKKGISKESVASSRSRTLLTFYEETGIPILLVKRYIRELGNDNEMFFSLTYDKQKSILLEYKKKELLKIDVASAKEFLNNYLNTYQGIKEYMEKEKEEAYQKGYVTTIMNRRRKIDELKSSNYMVRSSGERMALNTPIQGSAADILKKAMVELYRAMQEKKLKSKILIQVHDELVFNIYNDELEIMKELVKEKMEKVVKLSVPLKVDIETGNDWYEAK